MSFRDSFTQSRYDDAPHLSDQLLLPNLAKGHDVHLFSAFAPSYLFGLVSDLAKSPEIEPGFLSITFFVPGDLTLRSSGIARFRNYLLEYAASEQDVALFVNQVLQLAEEGADGEVGGIRVSILHANQKRPLTKGCIGVVSSSEATEDYVAFVDARGGDYNSPATPLKSWEDSDYFAAEDVLRKIIEASTGSHSRGILVSEQETLDWFTYLSNWYVENPPAQPETIDSEPESEVTEDDEPEDEFLEYLRDLSDFEDC
jgi:ribosomal protein S28E/S33